MKALNFLIQSSAAERMMPGHPDQLIIKETHMHPHDAARAEALANPYDAEVRDILWIDVPRDVAALAYQARLWDCPQECAYGRGISLRVSSAMAQVIMEDPTPEAEAELERSGHSFLVVRS